MGCVYLSLINTQSFGRFWPVSWTITQFWSPGVIFTIDEPRGATLTILADSVLLRALLLTVLASQSGFHYLQSVGAFAFLSSTLTVLANSDAICGLLLII